MCVYVRGEGVRRTERRERERGEMTLSEENNPLQIDAFNNQAPPLCVQAKLCFSYCSYNNNYYYAIHN